MKTTIEMTGPVAEAVLPLKVEAIQSAEIQATKFVEKMAAELEAAAFDTQVCAPYPGFKESQKMSRFEYAVAVNKHTIFVKLTERTGPTSYRMNEPRIAKMNPEAVAKFIEEAKEDAAFQYDKFVLKLMAKIGPVETATIEGSHVWGHSVLTVTKTGSAIEFWKTQQIWNVSKLGKPFPQWPSRKVKTPH